MSSPTATGNINDTFFNGNYKEVWRRLIPPGLSELECDLIQELAGLQQGHAVLDLMCGYGRHSLPLARRGFSVTAIDNSADYIAEIQRTASAEALPVQAYANSVLTQPLSQTYQAAICMGNSFAFFPKADALGLLKKIGSHLQPRGILLINTWVIAEIAIRHFREKDWQEMDGYKCLVSSRYLFSPSRIESEHTVIDPAGNLDTLQAVDYIYALSELDELFHEAGLSTTAVYSTPRKRPFRIGDATAYIVATKH